MHNEQRFERVELEVGKIKRIVGEMAGDLTRLKDYVTAQLDLRAPFAFLPFNQITQTHPDRYPPPFMRNATR